MRFCVVGRRSVTRPSDTSDTRGPVRDVQGDRRSSPRRTATGAGTSPGPPPPRPSRRPATSWTCS